jgi:hypothetical protein
MRRLFQFQGSGLFFPIDTDMNPGLRIQAGQHQVV